MPYDSYHGDSTHLSLGLRIGKMDRTAVFGVSCLRCDKHRLFTWETLRHFRMDMPTCWLPDVLTVSCVAKKEGGECHLDFASPDDGCAMMG